MSYFLFLFITNPFITYPLCFPGKLTFLLYVLPRSGYPYYYKHYWSKGGGADWKGGRGRGLIEWGKCANKPAATHPSVGRLFIRASPGSALDKDVFSRKLLRRGQHVHTVSRESAFRLAADTWRQKKDFAARAIVKESLVPI